MIFIFLIILISLECFYIFYLETIATTSDRTAQTFNMTKEELATRSVSRLFKNQGVYNGLIGVGLLYSLLFSDSSVEIIRLFLIYIVLVAIYGSLTVDKKIILKQGGLPIIALLVSLV